MAATSAIGTLGADADVGSTESTFVPVTPIHILDTRGPTDLGLAGPFVSPSPLTLQVTGAIPTAAGTQTVVPDGSSGVVLNVTVAGASAAGFLSVRPADTAGPPGTSSLNFDAGAPTPNAVNVSLPTSGADAGRIEITYDAYGQIGPSTDVLVDVVGYTTTAGLGSIVADLAAKANATDVYTKAQADAAFVPSGEVVVEHGHPVASVGSTTVERFNNGTRFTGDGSVTIAITAPDRHAGTDYELVDVEYCLGSLTGGAVVASAGVTRSGGTGLGDNTVRSAPGCDEVVVDGALDGPSFGLSISGTGGSGSTISVIGVRSTWMPVEP